MSRMNGKKITHTHTYTLLIHYLLKVMTINRYILSTPPIRSTTCYHFFFSFSFFLFSSHLYPMDLIITIPPVVTKDLPISPRFTPYDFLSRCKFSTLTTRQPMVEFYLLTFPRFPLRKKEHKSYFGKNRTHDFRTSRCAAYLLDHSGDERLTNNSKKRGKREAYRNWSMVKPKEGSTRSWNDPEDYWPCAGGLSALNALRTQSRDLITLGLNQ